MWPRFIFHKYLNYRTRCRHNTLFAIEKRLIISDFLAMTSHTRASHVTSLLLPT